MKAFESFHGNSKISELERGGSIMLQRKSWLLLPMVMLFSLMAINQAIGWSLKEAAKPYKGTTVYVLINHHRMYEYSEPYIPEFERETGIKVNVELLTRRTMNTKQEFELGSNTAAYDLMYTSTAQNARYLNAEWCTPLNDFMNNPQLADPTYDHEDFMEAARETFVQDGVIYGLPWGIETQTYCYRTDIFEKYGIPGPPKTYQDLENVSKKIHTKEIPAISLRAKPGQYLNIFVWPLFLWGFGGRWFDEDLKPVLNSEAAIKATEFYCKLLQNWGPEGYSSYIHYEIRNDFQTGKLASFIDADGLTMGFNDPELSNVIDKWAVAPIPVPPDGIFAPNPYSQGMFMAYDAPNKEAAFLFMQWYTSKEMERRRAFDHLGKIVTRKSVRFTPEWMEKYSKNNFASAVRYSLEHSFPYVVPAPWLPEYNEIGDRLGIAVQEILIGEKTAKEALDEVNEEIYLFMRLGGYYKRGMRNPNKVGL